MGDGSRMAAHKENNPECSIAIINNEARPDLE